jgi:hypothetical protein
MILPVAFDEGGYDTSAGVERPGGCTNVVYFEETQWP